MRGRTLDRVQVELGGGGWQGVRRLDKDVFRDLPVTGSSHDIPKCFLPLHPSVLEFLRRITADPAIPYPSSAYFHPSADGRTECNHASSAMIYAFCRAGITLRVHARPRDLPLRMYRCIYPMLRTGCFTSTCRSRQMEQNNVRSGDIGLNYNIYWIFGNEIKK